jgi:hypothetical protein
MKNILLTATFVVQSILAGSLWAQTGNEEQFSLQEAQAYALENSYSLKSVNYDLAAAKKKGMGNHCRWSAPGKCFCRLQQQFESASVASSC